MSEALRPLAAAIARAAGSLGATLTEDEVLAALGTPPRPEMGDVAFPTFPLARALRNAPPRIAADLAEALRTELDDLPDVSRIEAAGPYLNAHLDPTRRARRVIEQALDTGYGRSSDGVGRKAGIDYSSPNIAKPFGIGHLRSTVIGNALRRLHEFQGWQVTSVNHLGDWGTQFGKLMAAFERWGDETALLDDPIQHLYRLYVDFHREIETRPELEEEGRAWFRRLEEDDPRAREYWERFRTLSLREFQRIYDRLGVSFDHFWGEAWYNGMLEPLVNEMEQDGLLVESEGARVVPLDDLELPPCLIVKSDGASLYATRDLAAARYRHDTLGTDRFLYVVGAAQSVHFQQVFAVLDRMGHTWARGLAHVPFGMILGISTRKGTLVFLEDVLDRGRDLALEVLRTRPGLSDEERARIADQIAVGAVVFADLSRNRMRDYEFDWDRILDWNGRTGPYLQYTHVRLGSLEQTFRERFPGVEPGLPDDLSCLDSEHVRAILQQLERFPTIVVEATRDLEPSQVSRYLLDLAEAFNAWYSGGERLLTDDVAASAARLAVARAVRQVLGTGLGLIGVPLPDRM
ncbi:MAG: arginine--tRNA ligase [Deltaproteobacteria bacterium]|nr:MAG: arginine--tRNA ligase [Deltaproteobacteria bacterium]